MIQTPRWAARRATFAAGDARYARNRLAGQDGPETDELSGRRTRLAGLSFSIRIPGHSRQTDALCDHTRRWSMTHTSAANAEHSFCPAMTPAGTPIQGQAGRCRRDQRVTRVRV